MDRGSFSCEVCAADPQVIMYLVAYSLAQPGRVVLLRGNHEARRMNTHFNFRQEVLAKYSEATYEQLEAMFDALPLAALVSSPHGRCFCVHGGIGPGVGTVGPADRSWTKSRPWIVSRKSQPRARSATCSGPTPMMTSLCRCARRRTTGTTGSRWTLIGDCWPDFEGIPPGAFPTSTATKQLIIS